MIIRGGETKEEQKTVLHINSESLGACLDQVCPSFQIKRLGFRSEGSLNIVGTTTEIRNPLAL